ncbi:Integrin alpha [Popillia japonica]|uniref:Integrin alpha n=1 Tax=Popillia japonica TaxID=7064 RepID=A0AAW1IUL7_POPJA
MNLTLSTEIRQFPPACSKVENILHCDISNRFVLNQTKQLEFQLDVKRIDPRMQEIKIEISVNSASTGNGSTAQLTIALPVALRSNLTFVGFANPEYLENRDSANFTHEYVVFNSGPSPLLDKKFLFEIPENVINSNGGHINPFIITPLADECIPGLDVPSRTARETNNLEQTLAGLPPEIKHNIGCRQNELMTCKTYSCIIGELVANTSMKFRFKVEVKGSLLFDALGEEVKTKSLFIVESIGAAVDGSNNDKEQEVLIRTVLFRKAAESMQSLWVWIVVAVISSIMILLVIIVILYKLKFFARPMRQKLLNEEEHHHERECMIVSDDSHCDSSNSPRESSNSQGDDAVSEPFKDIKF